MLPVTPYGGLANRLRVIFSYYWHATENGKGLQVHWSLNHHVSHARWSDVFEPIEGIQFVTQGKGKGARTCKPLSWKTSPQWTPLYKHLKLIPKHQNKLNQTLAKLGQDFIAVHVRKTDLPYATSNDIFYQFIDALPVSSLVYVATDNSDTLREFILKYGHERVIQIAEFRKHGNTKTSHRNTSLADAAIDLFVCAAASHFKGTHGSSFTEAIGTLRTIYGTGKNRMTSAKTD